eukprot:SAG11_NODE_1144_length_5695_cov_2.181558_2_plen_93_part_00
MLAAALEHGHLAQDGGGASCAATDAPSNMAAHASGIRAPKFQLRASCSFPPAQPAAARSTSAQLWRVNLPWSHPRRSGQTTPRAWRSHLKWA